MELNNNGAGNGNNNNIIRRSGYKGPYNSGPIRRTIPDKGPAVNMPGAAGRAPGNAQNAAGRVPGNTAGAAGSKPSGMKNAAVRMPANSQNAPVRTPGNIQGMPVRNQAQPASGAGIDFKEPVSIIYFSILAVCLAVSIIVGSVSGPLGGTLDTRYGFSDKMSRKLFSLRDSIVMMPTIMGLIPELLDEFIMGDAAKTDDASSSESAEAGDVLSGDGTITTTNGPDTAGSAAGSGNAMLLDKGQGSSGYPEAASHTELVTQLESALAAGDYTFTGTKLAYKDDYGELAGYPQSVVSYFTDYMAANAEKRTEFISEISGEDYSAMNGTAYVVLLPVIQFTVNMAYDNTTVSVPGFGDQIVNSGQSAVIKPLLPCMYSVTLSNQMWSAPVTKEIETSLDELSYSLSVS